MTLRILLAGILAALLLHPAPALADEPPGSRFDRDIDDVAGQKVQSAAPPPPPSLLEAPLSPDRAERLRPFAPRSLGGTAMPSLASAVAQNPRLGTNFANYPKSGGGTAYADMKAGGATHDRVSFNMDALRPTPGAWQPGGYDALLADAAAQNIQVLGVLVAPPNAAWACEPTPFAIWCVPKGLNLPWNDPNNVWAQYAFSAAQNFKGRVAAWEVWNEPNIDFWSGTPQQFARLLMVSYQAIKAADPNATVVMGGMLRGNNLQRVIDIYQAISELPNGAANKYYFDVLGYHSYDDGTCTTFDTMAYLELIWKPRVGPKPVWITEAGIAVADVPIVDPQGYALPDEQASFMLQSYTYALYKYVERYYYFRAIHTGEPIDWGLLKQDGAPRPGFAAYQVAAQHLPTQYDWSVRRWQGNAVSRISFYGTPLGRVSVIWNITDTAQSFAFSGILPNATLVQPTGASSTIARDAQGNYAFNLPPAPNFRHGHPEGICKVASPPLILIERDVAPPSSALAPLPAISPSTTVTLTWSGADAAGGSGIWWYELERRQGSGPWMMLNSEITATQYAVTGTIGATYAFRLRARDRAGNLQPLTSSSVVTTTIVTGTLPPPTAGLTQTIFLPVTMR